MSPDKTQEDYSSAENQHLENTGSGILRATIFGVSDGLVSNLALVMGVAGGSRGSAEAIIIAGTAGLLAGAFSMAAGEYISMLIQRETMEKQLRLEREHILEYPEEEKAHLESLLIKNGLPESVASDVAAKAHEEVESAVWFHALHELGIVPDQMGSPIAAAASSFLAFTAGAAIPLLPWLILPSPLFESMIISSIALLVVGAAVTTVTHRSAWWGALRQWVFGGASAGITYWLGTLIGGFL